MYAVACNGDTDNREEKTNGITSYLDAIALGMPVVTSKNAAFAAEIEFNKLGLLYECGSDEFDDVLEAALQEADELSDNISIYSNTHKHHLYSDIIIKILKNLSSI